MKQLTAIALTMTALAAAGCVERTIKITTQPPGATVLLNDEEVGRTPADVHFTWHGTYDVIVRKEGYRTMRAPKNTGLPVYQWPVVDIFTELLIPYKWHEQHTWHFDMEPQRLPERQDLINRATDFRQEAAQVGTTTQPSD